MHVFLLQHERPGLDDDEAEDVKVTGIFSSRQRAAQVVDRLRQQSGFSRYPDGFHISEYEMDRAHWTEGFETLSNSSEP